MGKRRARCYNSRRTAGARKARRAECCALAARVFDIAVIGGGIIGLATAMRLAQKRARSKIVVLEKEERLARHQTGHNSGVIHAGIYYAPGSSKANFCSTGGALLRRFCDDHGVRYEMCGKVIVATDDSEIPGLEELHRRGTINGAAGLQVVDRDRLLELEPHSAGVRAIHSPGTGIIDFTEVCEAYAAEFRRLGGEVELGAAVTSAAHNGGGCTLETSRGDYAARGT